MSDRSAQREGARPRAEGTAVRFGAFDYDAIDRRLTRDETEVALAPKALGVLDFLLSKTGKLATKEEILAAVWPDVAVTEAVLKVAIGEIRKALGDSARDPQFIQTVHRIGYRFIAELKPRAPEQDNPLSLIVGRDESLSLLDEKLDLANGGRRSTVFVAGEAGIGKSALIETFVESAKARSALSAIGRCRESYGEGEAFLPLLEILGSLVRAAGGERVLEALSQHSPTWLLQMPWFLSDGDRSEIEAAARNAGRARMLREVVELIEVVARDRLVLLVFEDLHWSDPSTLDALAALAQRTDPSRLMIVGTYRSDDAARTQHPINELVDRTVGARSGGLVSLGSLTRADIKEYLHRRLGGDVSSRVVDVIHDHCDGNSLFVTSFVAQSIALCHLAESNGEWDFVVGMSEVEAILPEELKGMLERRAGRLGERALHVLEVASVLGPEFTSQEVASVLSASPSDSSVEVIDQILGEIEAADSIVRTTGFQRLADGTLSGEYRFAHVLQQRVISLGINPIERAGLHSRVATHLKGAGAKNARLAFHHFAAQEFDQAVAHWGLAGAESFARWANHESIAHFERALETLDQLPHAGERDNLELDLLVKSVDPIRAVYGPGAAQVGQKLERALAISKHVEPGPHLYPLWAALFAYYVGVARFADAQEMTDRLMSIAHEVGVDVILQSSLLMRGIVSLYSGRLELAVESMDASLALAPDEALYNFGYETQTLAYLFSSLASQLLGRCEDARRRADAGRACAEREGDAYLLTMALQFEAFVARWQGDLERTRDCAERVDAICLEENIYLWAPVTGWILAWIKGREEGAASQIEGMLENLAHYDEIGTQAARTDYLAATAEACAEAGQIDRGLNLIEEALAHIRSSGERFAEAEVLRVRAVLYSNRAACDNAATPTDDGDEARASVVQAIELAREQGARFWELRSLVTLCELADEGDDLEEARASLRIVMDEVESSVRLPEIVHARRILSA